MNRPWLKFYPPGIPTHINYPEAPLFQFLTDSANRYPTKAALSYNDQEVTYQQLDNVSTRFAAGLRNIGLKQGNRVMLFLPNIPEYVIAYYGILKAGAIVSSASPLLTHRELAHQLNDSGASVLVTSNPLYPVAAQAKGSDIEHIVVVDKHAPRGTKLFSDLCSTTSSILMANIRPKEDIAVLQYTGGTTGLPRGAMMTHYNLVANAVQNTRWFNWTDHDTVLAILPFCHTWSTCVCINSPILVGVTTVLIERFDPTQVLQMIQKKRITICYGSATMFNLLVNHPRFSEYDLSSLRVVKAGAMPVPDELKRQWDKSAPVELISGYGLTEASPETHNNPPHRTKMGSAGIPIIDTDAKIVDLETGTRELPPRKTGELVLRGPQVTSGYWKAPEQSRQALKSGWLHTGDIARMDEEGYFYIVERKKDLIKYKGYSVFPAELENVLYEHPAVQECLVLGVSTPSVGEIPKAFIIVRKGHSLSKEEVVEFCQSRVAPYKKIRDVEFVRELPKTVTGKPLRRLLR
jgi:long-chain acyl-CoA synthetase